MSTSNAIFVMRIELIQALFFGRLGAAVVWGADLFSAHFEELSLRVSRFLFILLRFSCALQGIILLPLALEKVFLTPNTKRGSSNDHVRWIHIYGTSAPRVNNTN